jgi:hypothetical protein
MGYDCTLHLVDEAAIRRELVPRLLGTSKKMKLAPFEDTKAGAKLLAKARKIVFHDDPDDAARALTELAIHFASAALPHLEARGCALSLWHHMPAKVRARSPVSLGTSPEALFSAVVAKRRELRGRFPTEFDENYMTGVFIPAKKIAAARAWMKKHLAVLSPGERLVIDPIERVLAAADEHGLAYWEATDLVRGLRRAPNSAAREWLAEPKPDVVGSWTVASGIDSILGRQGDLVFALGDDDNLTVVDVSRKPPKVERLERIDCPSFVARVERTWFALERRKDQKPYRWRLFAHAGSLSAKAVDAAPGFGGRALAGGAVIGGEIYAHDADAAPPRLLRRSRERSNLFAPVPGVPLAKVRKSDKPVVGFARTSAGDEILVWDGDGWELAQGRLKRTFRLGIRPSYWEWSYAPAGPSSFFYLSARQIFRAERGKKPKRVASKLTNVLCVSPGPAGALLFCCGEGRRAWVVGAVRPNGTIAGLTQKQIGGSEDDVVGVEWSEAAGALYVLGRRQITAIARSKLGI